MAFVPIGHGRLSRGYADSSAQQLRTKCCKCPDQEAEAAGKTGTGNRYQAEARLQLAETNRQADWMHIVPASRVKASPASS